MNVANLFFSAPQIDTQPRFEPAFHLRASSVFALPSRALLTPLPSYQPSTVEHEYEFSRDVDDRRYRRNRTNQSCINCHTSKQKCDRQRPCQRCIQPGLTDLCVNEIDDSGIRDDENTRIHNRIVEPERLVREPRGETPIKSEPGDLSQKFHHRFSTSPDPAQASPYRLSPPQTPGFVPYQYHDHAMQYGANGNGGNSSSEGPVGSSLCSPYSQPPERTIHERGKTLINSPPLPWGSTWRQELAFSSRQPPPDKLHPTLSSWLKNINKLDSLINRLQELASLAPTDHRPQLLRKVAAMRATFKKQQQRCIEFLQLSEDYTDKCLLDIDDEIRQQCTLLDNLEERLEAAEKLHGDAVELQKLYESGIVASMNDLRATGISRPLPQDNALFEEVDFVMAEIRRFYEELNRFWREEICHVVEALKKRRIDPKDFERWNSFRSSLKQTIESWKNRPPGGDTQTVPSNNTSPSTGVNLGAIASSLSSTSDSFREALDRMFSSASLRYSPPLSRSSFQRLYVAFEANRDMCLSFLRHCDDYGEKMVTWCLPFNPSPISYREGAPHDMRERTARLLSETAGVSMQNAVTSVKGSRRCKTTYKKAAALERKTTSELNDLLESLSSWVAVIDRPSGDVPNEGVHHQELGELKCAWEKTRDCMRSALETLTSGRVHHHRSSPTFTHCRSALRRWMASLV